MGFLGIIGSLWSALSALGNLQTLHGLLVRMGLRRPLKDLHSRSEIIENPSLIMGDRGEEKNGFLEDVYLMRSEIDTNLADIFQETNHKNRMHNIVVVTGRHASGKSRVVWEFIRSDVGAQFKSVYIPRISPRENPQGKESDNVNDLKNEMARLNPSALVVLDDFDDLLEIGYKNLSRGPVMEILSRINDRNQACLITLSSTSLHYQEFRKIIDDDSALGRTKTKGVLFLDIEDVQPDDDTHLWCTANLPLNRYSKVIGGYIPLLTRHGDVNIKKIVDEPAALLYLTSFIILKKFRNRYRVLIDRILRLYQTIREEENLDDIPEVPGMDQIRVLFDMGMIRFCQNRIEVAVDDESLFESFNSYCVTHRRNDPTKGGLIARYLADTRESESEQILRLVDADRGNDPAVFSRIITRTRYPELREEATNWFIEKFFQFEEDGSNLIPKQIKPRYESNSGVYQEIRFTVGSIVGRASDPIGCSKNFIAAGIKPDINLVDELIRAAMKQRSSQMQKVVKDYAMDLKQEYEIEDNLYFCQVLESYESGYDEDRVRRAIELYDKYRKIYTSVSSGDDESLENLEITMDVYCSRLAQKADSIEKMDQYFALLRKYTGLYLGKSALRKLVIRISGKSNAKESPLLLHLSEELLNADRETIREDVRNTGLLTIMDNCPNARICLNIYERVAPRVESTMYREFKGDYRKKEKLLNLMVIHLARKMKGLSLESEEYGKIQSIVKERVNVAYHNEDFGVAHKLYNVFLNNQPLRPEHLVWDHLKSLMTDESWLSGKRDIHLINSAFQNALEPYQKDIYGQEKRIDSLQTKQGRCDQIKQIALQVNELREKEHILADGRFKLFLFRAIDLIHYIGEGAIETDTIREKIDFSEDPERLNESTLIKDELLWCQVFRNSDNPGLLIKAAVICLELTKKDIYLMDTVNHLMGAFCDRFQNNAVLKEVLQKLEKSTYDYTIHSVHDYCHYLAFGINTGSLENEHDVIDLIDDAWNRLQHADSPLRIPGKADLLCAAINIKSFNSQQAIDIVNYAIDYDKRCRYRPSPILSIDVILELAKKFKNEEEDLNRFPEQWSKNRRLLFGYADQIQEIIYSLDTIEYSDKDFVFTRIKNPIDAPLKAKYNRKSFTHLPIESDNANIRRDALLKRIDDNGKARCSVYEALSFLYPELYFANSHILSDIKAGDGERTDISDYLEWILLDLESARAAGMRIKLDVINRERYLKPFAALLPWQEYKSFFEGYLKDGYVPMELEERWVAVAKEYGFLIDE